MRTAISIPDTIFQAAEQLARRLGKSRSELYSQALAVYIEQHRTKDVTKRLNSVYEAEPSEPDPVLQLLQLRSLPKETKLPKDSVANVSQIITVDRAFLAEKVGKLPEQRMREVEDGLRLMLELS